MVIENTKKVLVIIFLVMLLVGMVGMSFAYTPQTNFTNKFPIQVMPKISGYIKPNTAFDYTFVFATDENCVDDVYTTSVTINTDRYGVGSTLLDLSTMNEIPSFLCEYRDGSLRKTHPLNERLFMEQITEQDIENYGFIKTDTNTQLNESQVDFFVNNNGYLKNETDPTVTLQKLQNLTFNDFHNLGGIDRVLNKSEIEDMGFSTIDNDYCSNGVCNGDVTITGDLTLIGSITNVNATDVKSNGSIVPEYNGVFDIGSIGMKWNNIYANQIDANIDYSKVQNVPNFLLSESDPKIGSTLSGQWCRGTGTGVSCDVTPVVDTKLTDSDITTFGYIKTYTEVDPLFSSSASSGITLTDINNWGNAFNWGNHANEGYLTDANDAVDSNELDGLCNQNGMILKRINNTWGCSNDVGFIPTSLLIDYNFTDNSINWDQVYSDYYNNTNGYLTSESDPVFVSSPSYNINNSDITNWNTAFNWGNHNLVGYLTNETDPIFTTSPSFNIENTNISNWNLAYNWGNHNNVGYLTVETDPLFSSSPSNNITNVDLSNWNDAYNWGDHNSIGYLTTETDPLFVSSPVYSINNSDIVNWNSVYFDYYNNTNNYLEVETDPIYIAEKSGIVFYIDTALWDKNVSDDFNGDYNNLYNQPLNLSEFANDVGYITSYIDTQLNESQVDDYVSNNGYLTFETDPIFTSSDVANVTSSDILNWNNVFGWGNHNLMGYLTSFTELDPIFTNSSAFGITQLMIDNWNYVYNQVNAGGNSSIVFENDTILWDKDYTDDFDYQWSSLLNIPLGFIDGVDNDTKYYNVSEFVNDANYITNLEETDQVFVSSDAYNINSTMINNWNNVYNQINDGQNSSVVFLDDTTLWDKNVSDDFDYQWSSLQNVPSGFADNIDNDTKYYNLSEFVNDVGYVTNQNEIDPIFTSHPTYNITQQLIDDWEAIHNGEVSIYNPVTVEIVDEFLGYSTETGEIGNLGWSLTQDFGGYTFYENSVGVLNKQHIGVLVCSSHRRINSGCYYNLGDSSILSDGEKVGFIINSLNPTYSNQRLGLFSQISSSNDNINNGVYFRLNDLHSNVLGVVKYNNIQYTCDTGVPIIGSKWYKLEFQVDLITDTVNFYVNDAQIPSCSISNNIPENKVLGPKMTFYSSYSSKSYEKVGMVDVFWISYEAGQRWD